MTAADGGVLRDVRLRALRDAPSAFEGRVEDVEGDPEEEWSEWAAGMAAPSREASAFLAFADDGAGTAEGMAGGYLDRDDGSAAVLWGVWVDPRARGHGHGAALIDAVESWAATSGRKRLTLWVSETSAPAQALYRRCGFEATGETRAHPGRAGLSELRMERPLRQFAR